MSRSSRVETKGLPSYERNRQLPDRTIHNIGALNFVDRHILFREETKAFVAFKFWE